jgi:hypothetical protein
MAFPSRFKDSLAAMMMIGIAAAGSLTDSAAAQLINPFNGHTYFVSEVEMTAPEAEEWAASFGSDCHLVVVNDQQENDWIYENIVQPAGEHFWIGYWQDCPDEYEPGGGWYWLSGEHATYTNWRSGEPNDNNGEDYAQIQCEPSPGLWNDTLNDDENRAIAEVPRVVLTPTTAVSFQNEGTSSDDVTALVAALDGTWAPVPVGTVIYDYYSTGSDPTWFDALSLSFDVGFEMLDLSGPATLHLYMQRADYDHPEYEHFGVYLGDFDSTDEDVEPWLAETAVDVANQTTLPPGTTVGWVSIPIPDEWLEGLSSSLDLTLRLWNFRVDALRLEVQARCPADVDGDGDVDVVDLLELLGRWGVCP